MTDEAQRKANEALRLDAESREHKSREGRERRRAVYKRRKADELRAECARLGIKVVFHRAPNPPHRPKGGHSESSPSSSRT